MPPTITVRPASPHDLAGIAVVAAEGWRNAYRDLISAEAIEEVLSRWYSVAMLERRLSLGGLDVAHSNGQVIGFINHGPATDQVYEVSAFYVLPDFLRKGAGWEMWQRVIRAARLAGFRSIELWVLKDNKLGIDWYNRQNGVVAGERQVEMLDGSHSELRYRFNLEGL